MWRYALSYLIALVTFVAADMAWIGTMASRFYKPMMGDIVTPNVNYTAAIVFYAVYPIGLVIFAINPALKADSAATALGYGALFGFFTYFTYNLTNQALLRNWSTPLTLVDIAWGTTAAALASLVTFWVIGKFVSNV